MWIGCDLHIVMFAQAYYKTVHISGANSPFIIGVLYMCFFPILCISSSKNAIIFFLSLKTGLSSNYHCCSTIIQDIQYSAHTAFSSIHSDTMVLQAEKLKKPLKRCNDVIRFPSLCLPACLSVHVAL